MQGVALGYGTQGALLAKAEAMVDSAPTVKVFCLLMLAGWFDDKIYKPLRGPPPGPCSSSLKLWNLNS